MENMGKSIQLQQMRREIAKLDAEIENLNVIKAKLVKLVSEKPEKKMRPEFLRKLKKAIKEANEGNVRHYKSITEFDREIRMRNKKKNG